MNAGILWRVCRRSRPGEGTSLRGVFGFRYTHTMHLKIFHTILGLVMLSACKVQHGTRKLTCLGYQLLLQHARSVCRLVKDCVGLHPGYDMPLAASFTYELHSSQSLYHRGYFAHVHMKYNNKPQSCTDNGLKT